MIVVPPSDFRHFMTHGYLSTVIIFSGNILISLGISEPEICLGFRGDYFVRNTEAYFQSYFRYL